MLRIILFIATNIAVVLVLSVVLNLLGVDQMLAESGSDFNVQAMLIISLVFGMGGSFISLLISKWMAKRAMGVKIIEDARGGTEQWLVQTVSRHAQASGIGMPEVGIYEGAPNAFATGARRDSALVAVSSGLLQSMSQDEVDGVIAHEVAHIANGDMITLALVQGVVNTFVIFLSRVVGHIVDRVLLKNEDGHGIGYFVAVIASQIVFGILATPIVMWFSRYREFRADSGGARLAGSPKMIAALERLKTMSDPQPLPDQLGAFGISGGSAFSKLWSSHPALDDRIAALKQGGGQ